MAGDRPCPEMARCRDAAFSHRLNQFCRA